MLARNGPRAGFDVAVRERLGNQPWADADGMAWVDPFRPEVWEYNIDLAREAALKGFDEVQFDAVRFPAESAGGLSAKQARYSRPWFTERDRVDAVGGFLRQGARSDPAGWRVRQRRRAGIRRLERRRQRRGTQPGDAGKRRRLPLPDRSSRPRFGPGCPAWFPSHRSFSSRTPSSSRACAAPACARPIAAPSTARGSSTSTTTPGRPGARTGPPRSMPSGTVRSRPARPAG